MGISIAICELESKNALCRECKGTLYKVLVEDVTGLEDICEVDEYVTLEKAKELFPDWDGFVKRNRIAEDVDAIYMVKVKKDEDRAVLAPFVQRKYTGWVALEGLSGDRREEVISRSKPENRITGWDRLEFDEMNDMCARCKLSWDKGRGCMGAFGPTTSKLPEVAGRRGCPIVASVVESSEEQKRFSAEDAEELKREVGVLRAALPEEGKVYVSRYGGVLDRLEAVADVCISEGCGFVFF